jgi:hypothetical protein
MNIENINKRHFLKYNMYYRLEYGISSELIKYENCILYLEVSIGAKWNKPPYKTALEIAKNWRNTHPELKNALGAKIFILDSKFDNQDSFSDIRVKHKKGILFNFWNKN